MDLKTYIAELLFVNDCVIIPNVGGFILNYSEARIDFIDHQVYPPAKTVSFNPKLVNNDGLLANYIVQKEHINYRQAAEKVDAFSKNIEQDLFDNKIIHFPKVGKLYFNADHKLEFIPATTNFLLDTYGLPSFECYPILRNKEYLQKEKGQVSASHTTDIAPKKGTKTPMAEIITLPRVMSAAVIILLIAASPFIWDAIFNSSNIHSPIAGNDTTTVEDSQATTSNASVIPSTTLTENNYTEENTEENNEVEVTEESVEKENTTEKATEVVEPDVEESTEEVIDPNAEKFVVVLGAFSKKKNADRLAKKLEKDNYLPVIEKSGSGLHRVGVEITCTKLEFKKHFQYIRDNYTKSAWVVE